MTEPMTCAEVTALLASYDLQREVEGSAKREKARLAEAIKSHLEECREDRHDDPEAGLSARLQERTATPDLDLVTMAERDRDMLVALAAMGCLRVDWQTFKSNFGKSSAVDDARARYLMPGGATYSIQITKASR